MNTQKITSVMRVENAEAIIRAVLIHGTGWFQLAGVMILLTADVWLGAQVFMSRGMDWLTSYLISIATSAVQIALFANGGELIGKASGGWKVFIGYAALTIGWIVALLDSFIDGLAALVKLGGGIPKTWHEIWTMLGDPIVLTAFILFFILSLMGERLARLVIHGEFEEEKGNISVPQYAVPVTAQSSPEVRPLETNSTNQGVSQRPMGLVPKPLPVELESRPTGWTAIESRSTPGLYFLTPPRSGSAVKWQPGQPLPW